MGALRAAELAPYGMRGVGRIFELFRDGWLERDDEVAIAHSSAEAGYRAQSDALVNMRFTFRAAVRAGVVPLAFAERCAELAEHTFYAERTYAKVLSSAAAADGCADFAEALRSWLEPSRGNRVDQKYSDAVELLAWLARAEPEARPARPSFHFSNTHAFQELVKSRMRQ